MSEWFYIAHDEKQAIKNAAKAKTLHSGAISRRQPPPSYRALSPQYSLGCLCFHMGAICTDCIN